MPSNVICNWELGGAAWLHNSWHCLTISNCQEEKLKPACSQCPAEGNPCPVQTEFGMTQRNSFPTIAKHHLKKTQKNLKTIYAGRISVSAKIITGWGIIFNKAFPTLPKKLHFTFGRFFTLKSILKASLPHQLHCNKPSVGMYSHHIRSYKA